VTDAVLVVLHEPALPLHCALAWLAPMAVPSTIAANRVRVALMFDISKKFDGASDPARGLKPVLSRLLNDAISS
jgi:hypothetical protein